MDLQIIIPSLKHKIEKYAESHKELSQLLNDIQEKAKQNPRKYKSKKLLTQICTVEDTIDSIVATKMLQRQNISIEKVPVKYLVIAKYSVKFDGKFDRKLRKQTKELKEIWNNSLNAPVPEEQKGPSNSGAVEVPEEESSGDTVPQEQSSNDAADSDERHDQSWEEGSISIVLEELVSKLGQSVLLNRRTKQLLILKAKLEFRSDAIFLWTSYHSSVTKQHFQFRCWVVVFKESEESDILSDILEQAPSIKQEASVQPNQLLRKQLHEFLVFKRYLIVLYGELRDDVWNNLKSAFPYSLNGSRLLLISKGITSTNVSEEGLPQQLGKSKDYLLEESRILGIKDTMTELSQSILNERKLLFLISIVGVAESDKKAESEKKTLLWAMYSAEDIKHLFQYRAWVRVPKQFKEEDLQNLLADILKQVTGNKVEEGKQNLVTLQKKLCNFLASKRYLIVLYDVWTVDAWDKLKEAFPNSMNGSQVIITVHEADVAWPTNSSTIFGTVCGKELLHEKFSNLKVKHRWGGFSDVKAKESDLVGLDDKVQELAELLLESYQFLISLVGVPGSGKTMLVKAIYSSFAIKQHFDCRAFVSVSQEFEERKLLVDLSMQLGMVRKDESWSAEELQKRLGLFLAWKRYLIVLDDVHTADVWEKLNLAFPNSSNGSRVILTTCNAYVPCKIKAQARVIQLRLLNDDESWKLFVEKVPKVEENAALMEAVKEKILQICGGLPLYIVVLGGLLSTKKLDIPEWSKFIKQVSQKKEKKRRVTDEDRVNFSGQQPSSYMKPENGKKFEPDQSNSFTQRDSSDAKQEEKDDNGEIEEIGGLSEAPLMQEEEKVKHGATKEDEKPSPNQLPSSSDTKQKEDNRSFDRGQSTSSDETFSAVLALGYQDLNPHLKFCLNYLGLFPKSYRVPFRRLFQLLQAEGLLELETKEEKESSEDQVKKYIGDLQKRNMIEVEKQKLNGSPKTICMQSTIYDALSPQAERAGLFYIHFNNDKKDASKQPDHEFIRRFAEHQAINLDSLSKFIFQLRSYISFKGGSGDLPALGVDKLLKEGFGLIVILDLERAYKPVLSKHLDKFPNLKYLGLRWTFLDSIPDSVGDLPCLETLDMKHTNISTLPGEFWKAKCLQHLYMDNICVDPSILKASQKNESLNKLQILLGMVIRNKNSVDYLKAANGLRKLGVTCYAESIKEMVEWIFKLTQLQSLKLRLIDKSRGPFSLDLENFSCLNKLSQLYWFGKLPEQFDFVTFLPNLEILTLAMSELSKDPMEELKTLVNLKILRLHAGSYRRPRMTCRPGTFKKLQVLKLWKLEELEEWIVEKEAMPALEEVEIRCCKKLSNIDGLEELTTLKELLLTSMEQEFVKELKKRLGSNVSFVKENDWKFPSTSRVNSLV